MLHMTTMEELESCPKCRAHTVIFDSIQGIKACESCGTVLEEGELIHAWNNEGPAGVFVSADGSGRAAGAHLLPETATWRAIQRSSAPKSEVRLAGKVVRHVGSVWVGWLLQRSPSTVTAAMEVWDLRILYQPISLS